MNSYEARQQARKERLQAAADRKRQESEAAYRRSNAAVEGIPMGQPILIGHHSEGRHRAALKRAHAAMDKCCEASAAAKELDYRAASVGSGGISSDDPEAIDKLREKLAHLEAKHAEMIDINKRYRKHGWEGFDLPEETLARYKRVMATCSWEKQPFPGYALSNSSANLKRIRDRIAELERAAVRPEQAPLTGSGFAFREDRDDNRLLVEFDAPTTPLPARELLKSQAWKWSPTRRAWCRQLTPNAWASARYLQPKLEEILSASE